MQLMSTCVLTISLLLQVVNGMPILNEEDHSLTSIGEPAH